MSGPAAPTGASGFETPAPSDLKRWVLAARPKTLTAAAAPVLVGSACAANAGGFRPGAAAAALLGALLLQIGANFANDLFDFEKGADTEQRLGPTRAIAAGLIKPAAMRRAIALVFALAFLVGIYLVSVAGPILVVIGLASIAAALAYTGGPYPLGYHGLGDVCVMLFFGFVAVAGTAFVQAGHVPELAWWAALPVGCLATAILVVNNVRDIETDIAAGKRTLPARWGRNFGLVEYAALLAVAYASPLAWVVFGRLGLWLLLPLASAPLALKLVRRVRANVGRALNACLAGTAQLLFVFAVLLTLGMVLEARVWLAP
jgi:1,4-dihydroxy-2-naphthoate polyprenyltransferase